MIHRGGSSLLHHHQCADSTPLAKVEKTQNFNLIGAVNLIKIQISVCLNIFGNMWDNVHNSIKSITKLWSLKDI